MTAVQARAALEALGTTADEVAESLGRLGVKGLQDNSCFCPLAALTGFHIWPGGANYRAYAKTGSSRFDLNEACTSFVERFDAGNYPGLIRPLFT